MRKRYLFTPGPTPVPPEVLAAGAEPMVHHRGARAPRGLRTCARPPRRGASHREPDAALEHLGHRGDGLGGDEPLPARRAGRGDRRGRVRRALGQDLHHYGLEVARVDYEWRAPFPTVAAAAREAGAAVVFATQSETSTGVVTDIQALKAALGATTLVVDAVSSLGAVPLEMDEWGIDVVVSGSPEALMCSSGLASAAVAAPLWDSLPPSRSFYFDWRATRKAQEVFERRLPAVSLDPRARRRARHGAGGPRGSLDAPPAARPRRPRGVKAMGLELFSPDDDSSAVVTAIRAPKGSPRRPCCKHLRTATASPSRPAGRPRRNLFRIGHIGWFDVFDIAVALAALELALVELGAEIERGVAVTAASRPTSSPSQPLSGRRCGPTRSSGSPPSSAPARSRRRSRSSRKGTPTAEAAAKAIGCPLAQEVKSIVFVCDAAGVARARARRPPRRRGEGRAAAARDCAGGPRPRGARRYRLRARRRAPSSRRRRRPVLLEQTACSSAPGLDRRRIAGAHGRARRRGSCSASPARARLISSCRARVRPLDRDWRVMQATEKIWMNGELVDWDDARIHVGAHGLHYGSGVFEGSAARTPGAPPFPAQRPHAAPAQLGAPDRDGDPLHGGDLRDAATSCSPPTGCASATCARSPSTASASSASPRAATPSRW